MGPKLWALWLDKAKIQTGGQGNMLSKPNLGHECCQQLVLSFSHLYFLSLKFIKVFFLSFSHLRHLFNQHYTVFRTHSFQPVHNDGCDQLKVEIRLPRSIVSHPHTTGIKYSWLRLNPWSQESRKEKAKPLLISLSEVLTPLFLGKGKVRGGCPQAEVDQVGLRACYSFNQGSASVVSVTYRDSR